jgi:Membrane bound FAD containing D-sorbitol dehydrogenase
MNPSWIAGIEFMMPTLTRRGLLVGGVCIATATLDLPHVAVAQAPISVDQFRALSAELTGAAIADLDAAIAGQVLAGFLSLGRGPELAVLAADPKAPAGALANEIVAAWYSGSYETSAGVAAFDLTGALLWRSLDFTKTPGTCGGATGYWSDPPQT